MKYYLVDDYNGEVEEYASLDEAMAGGERAIQDYRDNCDPEWPDGVEYITVVHSASPPNEEEPQSGRVVARSAEFDRRDIDDDGNPPEGCDFWCNYRMEKVGDEIHS